MWRPGQVLTQQVSGDGSPEVDVSVPVALVQLAADVGMEVQVEGLYSVEEALQVLHEAGRLIPGAPVVPCVCKAWRGVGWGWGAAQA